ncbi:hypothetical protein AVEN_231337-1 [Araneus ventricosus]|uniref:Uncharacterized protein n=1 Tax=Araneus ventricosus TaxID=182803 RepID=A0A4Y2CIY2_ARAVE|nr:hypothetical protein AVEN_231337-1 [Araneus ventricosus]
MDIILVNSCQMTRTRPDLHLFSKLSHDGSGRTFAPPPYVLFTVQHAQLHDGSPVDSGYEPRTLWACRRDFSTSQVRLGNEKNTKCAFWTSSILPIKSKI